MNEKNNSAKPRRRNFNTLVQSGTDYIPHNAAIIIGKGTELGIDKVLKGRAKRKMITQKMALSFISISEKKGSTEKIKSFWNTYHCQNKLYSFDGRMYGKYCKNRYCTLCSSIRKAEIINKYYPVLKKWDKPFFVTLTVKACRYPKLKIMLKGLIRAFKIINEKYRKRNQRNNSIRLTGIRSLECNFNPQKKTYNPHLHLIVESEEIADIFINEWLDKWTRKFTIRSAQNKRAVKDLEKDLIETIKYGSKIFTEPDVNKKLMQKDCGKIYAAALYNIFDAMKGIRIFDRFGFNLPPQKKETTTARVITNFYEWVFIPKYFDWQNIENELVLSSFDPKPNLVSLLENNIDIQLE